MRLKIFSLVLLGGLGLTSAGCGGSQAPPVTAPPSTGNLLVTVGDSPMAGVLSAEVTIGSLTLNGANGATSLFSQPIQVELSHLGAIATPLMSGSIPAGDYTGLSLAVSAASVTYLDPAQAGQAITKPATLGPSTATLTFTQPLSLGAGAAAGLALDFDLANSFDLNGAALSFTPVVRAGGLAAGGAAAGLPIEMMGRVASVSGSGFSISTMMGRQLTFAVASGNGTLFGGGLTLSTLAPGMVVRVDASLQADGSLLATDVDASGAGTTAGGQDGCQGILTSVSGSSGTVSGFNMVAQACALSAAMGAMMQEGMGAGMSYATAADATDAGAPAFGAGQMFPGQAVQIMTATGGGGMMGGMMTASQLVNATECLHGQIGGAPQASGGTLSFALQLSGMDAFGSLAGVSNLQIQAGASTRYGPGMSALSLGQLSTGTALIVQGYVMRQGSGQYTMYATALARP